MAEEISVDSVCQFIISHGGKVKNTILVSHFKKSLNNPQTKDIARQKFKECVNTVAVVKTENNEKFVHLKKKYRSPSHTSSASSGSSDPSSSLPVTTKPPSPSPPAAEEPASNISEQKPAPNLNKSYDPVYDLPFADGASQATPVPESPKHHTKLERPFQNYEKQEDQHIYDEVPTYQQQPQPDSNASPKKLPTYDEHIFKPFTNEPEAEYSKDKQELDYYAGESNSPPIETTDVDAFGFNRKKYSPAKKEKRGSFKKQDNTVTMESKDKKQEISLPTSRPHSVSLPSQNSMDSSGKFSIPQVPSRKKKEKKENVPPSPSLDRHAGAIDRLKASLQTSGEQGRLSRTRPTSLMQASYAGSVEKARLNFQNKPKGNEDATSLALSERSVDSKGEGDQDYDDERIAPTFAMEKSEKDWLIKSCQGNMLEMRKLLNIDSVLADKKDFISSALHRAAKKGDVELIQMLLDLKVDVNPKSHGGYTPLHFAAMQGHEKAISLLLENNADPLIRDYSGKRPIQYLKSMSLPLQRLFNGNEVANANTTKDFAAGLRPRLDSVRKSSNRLSSVISGGIGSVGKFLSKSNEDLNQLSDGSSPPHRKGSLRAKMTKKKSRKKSKEEKPTISIVSYDDFDSGFHGATSISSLSSLQSSSSTPNLRKSVPNTPRTSQKSKDGKPRTRAETLDLLH